MRRSPRSGATTPVGGWVSKLRARADHSLSMGPIGSILKAAPWMGPERLMGMWGLEGGAGTLGEGAPWFSGHLGSMWRRNIHTLDTKQGRRKSRTSLLVLGKGSWEGCLTYFVWKAVIWGAMAQL